MLTFKSFELYKALKDERSNLYGFPKDIVQNIIAAEYKTFPSLKDIYEIPLRTLRKNCNLPMYHTALDNFIDGIKVVGDFPDSVLLLTADPQKLSNLEKWRSAKVQSLYNDLVKDDLQFKTVVNHCLKDNNELRVLLNGLSADLKLFFAQQLKKQETGAAVKIGTAEESESYLKAKLGCGPK